MIFPGRIAGPAELRLRPWGARRLGDLGGPKNLPVAFSKHRFRPHMVIREITCRTNRVKVTPLRLISAHLRRIAQHLLRISHTSLTEISTIHSHNRDSVGDTQSQQRCVGQMRIGGIVWKMGYHSWVWGEKTYEKPAPPMGAPPNAGEPAGGPITISNRSSRCAFAQTLLFTCSRCAFPLSPAKGTYALSGADAPLSFILFIFYTKRKFFTHTLP